VFQPLLYQCATGILSEGQITAPLRRILRGHRNVRCITAQAIDVDPPAARSPACCRALIAATGAERDRAGRIVVQDDLTIPSHPEISVVADVMHLRDLPGVAEVAMQTGLFAGRRVRHDLKRHPVSGAKMAGCASSFSAAPGSSAGRSPTPRSAAATP
jgi:NADH dehydrogenase FAD-containing subunit